MRSKAYSNGTKTVKMGHNSSGPWIQTGDCDFMPPMQQQGVDEYGIGITTSTYPIVTITYHEKGEVHTVIISAADVDIFLTNEQKRKLAHKIKLGRMVENL